MMAPHFVTPYRMQGKGGKHDANDAAAICEATSRPSMRFVPLKTPAQQAMLAIHRLREGYKEERNACINRIRGLLTEFGLVFAQRPEVLRRDLSDVLEDATNELPALLPMALRQAHLHWLELECIPEWSPAERFVSGPAPLSATRPPVDVQSVLCGVASSARKSCEEEGIPPIEKTGSPCRDLPFATGWYWPTVDDRIRDTCLPFWKLIVRRHPDRGRR